MAIRTAWGAGSGFFATKNCEIATNRHVVQIEETVFDRASADLGEAQISLDRLKTQISQVRSAFLENCSDCSEAAYMQHVGALEDKYKEAQKLVTKRRSQLQDVRFGTDLVVILADGSEHSASVVRVSESLDLAVLTLDHPMDCSMLSAGDEKSLEHGDRVFTIGSPMGLRHSVSSGVFSGHGRSRARPCSRPTRRSIRATAAARCSTRTAGSSGSTP